MTEKFAYLGQKTYYVAKDQQNIDDNFSQESQCDRPAPPPLQNEVTENPQVNEAPVPKAPQPPQAAQDLNEAPEAPVHEAPEASVPEASVPEASVPEASVPEASVPEAPQPPQAAHEAPEAPEASQVNEAPQITPAPLRHELAAVQVVQAAQVVIADPRPDQNIMAAALIEANRHEIAAVQVVEAAQAALADTRSDQDIMAAALIESQMLFEDEYNNLANDLEVSKSPSTPGIQDEQSQMSESEALAYLNFSQLEAESLTVKTGVVEEVSSFYGFLDASSHLYNKL